MLFGTGENNDHLYDECAVTERIWWVIPGALTGMPMPFIHAERRLNMGGVLTAYDDDLLALYTAGVRAVVCLLNIPSDAAIYESAGFAFKCLPVPDGGAPTMWQAQDFITFVDRQLAEQHPVVVHCQAGIGRTGTMLATYLISRGNSAELAIRRVRAVKTSAKWNAPPNLISGVRSRDCDYRHNLPTNRQSPRPGLNGMIATITTKAHGNWPRQ